MRKNESPLPGIDVLNTGYGDFEMRFDPNKPEEVEKAKQTITDMLKRGYAIFVRQGKETPKPNIISATAITTVKEWRRTRSKAPNGIASRRSKGMPALNMLWETAIVAD